MKRRDKERYVTISSIFGLMVFTLFTYLSVILYDAWFIVFEDNNWFIVLITMFIGLGFYLQICKEDLRSKQ